MKFMKDATVSLETQVIFYFSSRRIELIFSFFFFGTFNATYIYIYVVFFYSVLKL